MNSPNFFLKNLLLCFFFHFSVAIDTITPNSPVRDDGTVIVSAGKVFALGFFTPGHGISENRYVGIWYNQIPDQTVVWVANRENPIEDKSGILSVDNRGNLALFEKNQTDLPVWSTNVSVTAGNSGAQLLDSGNFVMFSNDTKRTLLWQSFDYPSNTMLPFMKLGLDRRTGLNRALTSWKSPDNPGIGNYSYRIDPTGFPQLSLYKSSDILWRTGSWTGQKWSGVPEMTRNFIFNVSFVNNEDEVSIVYGVTVASVITRMVVNESGVQQRFTWNAQNKQWIGFWTAPKEQCDFYNHCGPNSNCNPYTMEKFECYCLPGYEPKSPNEWYLRDGSGGCVKKPGGRSMCRAGEGFVKVERVKVPDTSVTQANMSLRLKECGDICLGNCSCVAYANAYDSGIGCLTWHGDLMDTRTYTNDGQDLYVRVDAVVLAQYARKKSPLENKGILALIIFSGAVLLITVVFFMCCLTRRLKAAGARSSRRSNFPSFSHTNSPFLEGSLNTKDINDRNASDLPFFDFSTIASATDNFSPDNKLGEGGFGSVYKGVLPNGKEIAIKRLSKHSGQGVEEFKNEITLIAKLQHRNLVRMLGYCIEKEEKMLIYEYLPNKSLDSFIFDETKRSLLDWGKRFEIICGIARGILYLHQDSRLRIIHRDLKASNVLLDAALNPKISDFGMARMFGGDQVEGSTIRVVGTYGYMSPEYAMHGQFSIKSDVYSFGILLLEIISGRKNSSHYADQDDHMNLVGHVWNLWREEKAMEIVDPSLKECYPEDEVSRCIHIAFLCVQESATDRPVMSTVVFMLSNAGAALPPPNHPAFVVKRVQNNGDDCEGTGSSANVVTITMVQGR